MNRRSLYPLDGLPQQRQLWSWISFDVANQSFTLIINTMLFSIFFSKVVVNNDAWDDQLWAIAFGGSMLLTAILSPFVGALADARAWKKELLIGSGLFCGIMTCALAFIQPGQILVAFLLYIPANFAFNIGENFLASFLPALAKQDQIGRVSGFSWAVAYGSALVLLIITAGAMVLLKLEDTDKWRPLFVFAGLWFIAFCVPPMLWLREPPLENEPLPGHGMISTAWLRLQETIHHTRRYRDLAILLGASLFYGAAISVVVSFASKLATEYGFDQVRLVIFMAVITVSGIIGTLIPTFYQDRLGHRRSVLLFLVIWLLTTCGFAIYAHLHDVYVPTGPDDHFATWPLWLIGNLLGFGLGSLGSANRAFVGYLAPPERSAEVFGMWGLVWKLSAVMTFPFGMMKDRVGTAPALWLLGALLLIGLVITLFINEKRGHLAAQTPPVS